MYTSYCMVQILINLRLRCIQWNQSFQTHPRPVEEWWCCSPSLLYDNEAVIPSVVIKKYFRDLGCGQILQFKEGSISTWGINVYSYMHCRPKIRFFIFWMSCMFLDLFYSLFYWKSSTWNRGQMDWLTQEHQNRSYVLPCAIIKEKIDK